jgi:hypothetical protein
MVFIALGVE